VSNTFTMDDWEPDQRETVGGECTSWCTALFWVVPAKVQGTWKMPSGTLTLTQKYQMVTGSLNNTPITEGRLSGDQISFTAGGTQYTGRVNGSTIEGTSKGAAAGSFRATKG
jgi:hypothetical protein